MEQFHLFAAIACAASGMALACGSVCLVLALRARRASGNLLALAVEMEGQLGAFKQELETLAQRGAEQRQRLALLESRSRVRRPESEPAASLPVFEGSAKPTVTEKRYRVLTLARRGLDVSTICETLSLPHGEVALIIGLSRTQEEVV